MQCYFANTAMLLPCPWACEVQVVLGASTPVQHCRSLCLVSARGARTCCTCQRRVQRFVRGLPPTQAVLGSRARGAAGGQRILQGREAIASGCDCCYGGVTQYVSQGAQCVMGWATEGR